MYRSVYLQIRFFLLSLYLAFLLELSSLLVLRACLFFFVRATLKISRQSGREEEITMHDGKERSEGAAWPEQQTTFFIFKCTDPVYHCRA